MVVQSKKIQLKEFLPHVLGMLLFSNGFLHLSVSILLAFGLETQFLSILDGNIPFWKTSVRLSGVIIGFILAIWQFFNGVGIYRRKKKAVYSTILLLFLSSIKYLVFNSFPQVVFLNVFFFVFLVIAWNSFEKDNSEKMKNYQEFVACIAVVLALIYGVAGSYMLKKHYVGIDSILDAVYYTVITYSTVGYGDIFPKNAEAKLFTITMVLMGLGAGATAVSFIIGPKIESKVKGIFKIMGNMNNMKDHVILCGFSELSKAVVKQLKMHQIPYVIIDNTSELINAQQDEEYIIYRGMISSIKTFQDVNIKKAKAVIIAFERDPENVLATLTVKEALENLKNADKIKVITRIENEHNLEKARKIGVHDIISPSTLAAKSILDSL
ncbi:MAG TPA: hypothetical protein DD381_03190 [Lentisphaeria bacterium]|nr:MAG: hypothetical protein A2X47_03060 [Lentisphaerae bacterium GWF2_38_69]HBM15338.1 hypothetical protein [Lentisphaeria bacterium]